MTNKATSIHLLAEIATSSGPITTASAPSSDSITNTYIELAAYFANLPSPISFYHLRHIIQEAWNPRANWMKRGQRSTPKIFAKRHIDEEWLSRLWPNGTPSVMQIIENVTQHRHSSTKSRLLALAGSFSDVTSVTTTLRRRYRQKDRLAEDTLDLLLPTANRANE